MSSLGEAVLDLTADDSALMSGVEGAKGKALNILGGLSSVGGAIVKAGLVAATAGAIAFGKGIYGSVQAAQDAEVVQAQLNAVLESTGGIAGVSADQINDLATSLSEMTMFDDEAIVSAESLLLTFTNIGKGVFRPATEAVLDMSQALGQDLQSSSIMLGKALQDPIQGITALRRVGVNFTDSQEDMIKALVNTGQLEEAQKLILRELQTEFGGSAEAAGKTFAGQLAILKTKLGNVQEMIGQKLLPVLSGFFDMLSNYLSKPETQAMLENLAKGIANFAIMVIENIPRVIQMFKDLFTWLQDNQGIVVGVLAALGTAIAVFAWTTMAPLLPIIAVMALIGLAAYLLYEAWTNNWGGIQEKMAALWVWLQPILQNLWNWLSINIPLAIQAMSNFWTTVLLPAIMSVWNWLVTNLLPILQNLWNWLSINVPLALQTLATFWTTVLLPAIMAVWTWLSTVLFPYFQALASFLGAVFSVAIRALAGIWQNVLLPAIKAVYEVISTGLKPVFEWLADFWNNTLQPIVEAIAQWIGQNVVSAFDSLTTSLQAVTTWLENIKSMLDNLTLPSWMTPGSPTPWEIGLLGVNDALKQVSGIGLPSLSANMGGISAPAIAGGGGMALSGAGGGMAMQFVYQPFIGVNDEYEAEQKLRGIVERISRRGSNQ
jgi:hypothetical protein